MTHETWMARAIEEAKTAARDGEAPVAAIVVRGNEVLGVGRNTKTSERSGFAHAEINALLAAKARLGRRPAGCVLYSTLEPCAMCLGAITFAGIRTLVYGAADPEAGAVAMFRQHPTYRNWMPEVVGGVLQQECEALKELATFKKDKSEIGILEALDVAVRQADVAARIYRIVRRVERALLQRPDDPLAWEPIPLAVYGSSLPATIRSSWVFVLRANTVTGAERHPNSRQRMVSYRGSGDLQTGSEGDWRSHFLRSDRSAQLEQRWISIPENTWHQAVVGAENWVVVSFHTGEERELVEERPDAKDGALLKRRKYLEERRPDDTR